MIALTLAFIAVLGFNSIGQFQPIEQNQDNAVFVNLSNSGVVCGNLDCAPSIAVDNSDIYVVWVEPIEGDTTSAINIVRSANEGDNFTTPRVIELTAGTNVSDPIIAVASNGELLLLWTDNRDSDFDLYASISQDQGVTWSWDETEDFHDVSNNDGDSLNPALDLGIDGTFVIAWSDDSIVDDLNPDGFRNIFVCAGRLNDLAMTQTFNVSQSTVISSRYGAETPAIAVHPNFPLGLMFVAWAQEGSRSEDVFFHQTTAFNPINVSNLDSIDANQVDIAIRNPSQLSTPNEGEQVLTVWVERVDGEDQVMLSIANNSGLPLTDPGFSTTPVNVSQSAESASNPIIATNNNGNFFVAWRQEDEDVRYRNTIQMASMVDVLGLPQEMSNIDIHLSARNVSISANDNSVFLIWMEENLDDGSTNIMFSNQNIDDIRIF
jgi:hypothetical protein